MGIELGNRKMQQPQSTFAYVWWKVLKGCYAPMHCEGVGAKDYMSAQQPRAKCDTGHVLEIWVAGGSLPY